MSEGNQRPFATKTAAVPETKRSKYEALVASTVAPPSVAPDFVLAQWQATLDKSVFLYAAVVRLAQVLAAGAWLVVDRKTKEPVEDSRADAVRGLLEQPNPDDDDYAFFYRLMVHLFLDGEAYAEKARFGRRVTELWPMNSFPVQPVPDKTGKRRVAKYIVTKEGRGIVLKPDDVVAWMDYDPNNEYRGLGASRPLKNEIRADMQAALYNFKLLSNGARTGGILTPKEGGLGIGEEQINRMLAQIEEHNAGASNAGRVLALNEPFDFHQDHLPPKDMDWIGLRKFAREAVSAAFGVPPILMHNYDSATYANANQQVESFYDHTGRPRLRQIFGVLNRQLVWPDFDDSVCLVPDWVGIQNQIEDTQTRTETGRSWFLNGLATLNEARRKIGLNSLGNPGEVFFVPLNGKLVRKDDLERESEFVEPPPPLALPGAGDADDDDEERAAASFNTGASKNGHVAAKVSLTDRSIVELAHIRALETVETKIAMVMERYLDDHRSRLLAKARMGLPDAEPESVFETTANEAQTAFQVVAPVILSGIEESGLLHAGRLGKGRGHHGHATDTSTISKIDLNQLLNALRIEDPRVLRFLEGVGSRMTAFTTTTLKGIREAAGSLLDRIRGSSLFGADRAAAVAQTEGIASFNLGALQAFNAANVPRKGWLTVGGDKVRESHRDAEKRYGDEPIPMNEPFVLTGRGAESRLMYPGDPEGLPHEVIRCRCSMVPKNETQLRIYIAACKAEVEVVTR